MLQSLSAKAGPAVRRIGAVAGVLALGLLSTSPAYAWWDRWHHWHRGYCCGPAVGVVVGAPPPPVVYAPPAYYAPPPVVYAPPPPPVYAAPGVSLGVTVPIR